MQICTDIKRWLNSRKVKDITYESSGIKEIESEHFGSIHAMHLNSPIGKIMMSYSDDITLGGLKFPDVLSGSSFLIINDIEIREEHWKFIGVGTKLVEKCVEELKTILPNETWVTGWVSDSEVQGFWKRFGFRYLKNENENYILCRLGDIKL